MIKPSPISPAPRAVMNQPHRLRAPTEEEMRLGAQVAAMAEEALASRDPTVIAELVAQVLARPMLERCALGREAEAEAFAHNFLTHILQRVEELAAAGTAVLRAMADAPR
jgi:hypothetical protein